MKRIPLLLLVTAFPLFAQDYPATVPLPIWEAPIPASQGQFTVSLNSICSIAVEHYDLHYEGESYPVTECSLVTVGGKTARFYFIDEKAADRAADKKEKDSPFRTIEETASIFLPESDDENASDKYRVVKLYPHSSTSSSVEYRLRSKASVTGLYNNLREAWLKWAP